MDDAKNKNILPVLMVLTIIFGGYMLSDQLLKTRRPNVPTQEQGLHTNEKFNARLWQDPFQAISDFMASLPKEEQKKFLDHSENRKQNIEQQINNTGLNTHIICVMIRDGTFAEDHERRLRNRYTVATALHDCNFIPKDPEHLSFITYNIDSDAKTDTTNSFKPIRIPYEWFAPDSITLSTISPDQTQQALVVWLPESLFLQSPLDHLGRLAKQLGYNHRNKKHTLTLIGPSHSGTLHAMLDHLKSSPSENNIETSENPKNESDSSNNALAKSEISSAATEENIQNNTESKGTSNDPLASLAGLRIYSPWSTVVPQFLIEPTQEMMSEGKTCRDELIIDLFKKRNITFRRMIGTDDLLSVCLLKELKLRGIDPIDNKDRIVLISEWDTLYGRAFTYTFASVLRNEGAPRQCPAFSSWLKEAANRQNFPTNLSVYYYIRGIDGKIPKPGSPENEPATDEKQNPLASITYTKCPESPTGQSQLDYIRYLIMQMNLKYILDKDIRPKAIGIISSDVYDKLLIIQALREEFRDILLFTVDLDSRLMHKDSFPWSHNVVVASNYGLKCNISNHTQSERYEARQFRDNYQSSLYKSCVAAVQDPSRAPPDSRTKLLAPKLFEIGRDRAVELKMDNRDLMQNATKTALSASNQESDTLKVVLNPVHAFINNLLITWQYIFLSSIGFMLLLCITRNSRKCLITIFSPSGGNNNEISDEYHFKDYHNELRVWFIGSIFFALVLMSIINIDHIRNNGEPFSMVTGTSIWPGSILRYIAIILGFFFILKSFKCLEENRKDLILNFFNKSKPIKNDDNTQTNGKRSNFEKYWNEDINFFNWKHDPQGHAQAEQVWAQYMRWGRYRLPRAFILTSFSILVVLILMKMMTYPKSPFRGNLSKNTNDLITILCAVVILFLICFVFDATCLCIRFIRNLDTPKTKWSREFLDEKNASVDMFQDDLIPLLNIKCIASRTDAVGKLVYYPSIILFIIIVSRSQFFDNWDFPMRLMVAHLVFFAIILSCALSMRKTSEFARSCAIRKLQENLSCAQSRNEKGRIEQIKLTIEEIRAIRKGAFSPLTENPVIHAILIPSGGTTLLMFLRVFMS